MTHGEPTMMRARDVRVRDVLVTTCDDTVHRTVSQVIGTARSTVIRFVHGDGITECAPGTWLRVIRHRVTPVEAVPLVERRKPENIARARRQRQAEGMREIARRGRK